MGLVRSGTRRPPLPAHAAGAEIQARGRGSWWSSCQHMYTSSNRQHDMLIKHIAGHPGRKSQHRQERDLGRCRQQPCRAICRQQTPRLTSLFTGWGLFPSFTSRNWSGEIMAPMLRMSAYFSSSVVRAVLGSPVKGPSPGSAPAVRDGSGICPGIIAGETASWPGGRVRHSPLQPSYKASRHSTSQIYSTVPSPNRLQTRESSRSSPGMAKASTKQNLGDRNQNI